MKKKTVKEKLDAILTDVKGKHDRHFIQSILTQHEVTREQWASWRETYTSDHALIHQMQLIEQTFEAQFVEKAFKGEGNTAVTNLALKSIYLWSDKKEPVAPETTEKYRPPYILLSGDRTIDL